MDPGLDALRRVKPLGSAGGEIQVYDRGELATDGSWHLGTFLFYQIRPQSPRASPSAIPTAHSGQSLALSWTSGLSLGFLTTTALQLEMHMLALTFWQRLL